MVGIIHQVLLFNFKAIVILEEDDDVQVHEDYNELFVDFVGMVVELKVPMVDFIGKHDYKDVDKQMMHHISTVSITKLNVFNVHETYVYVSIKEVSSVEHYLVVVDIFINADVKTVQKIQVCDVAVKLI